MKTWMKWTVMAWIGFGAASAVFADFRDFILTGEGTDDQWSTLANWEEGAFPTLSDSARIQKDCHIANGVTGLAGAVSIAGFGADAALYVDAGGTLEVSSGGINVAFSRKTALFDISGTLTSGSIIMMGTDATKTPIATVNFNPGASVSVGGIALGHNTPLGGTYTVNQTGGDVQLVGEVKIGDVNDALDSCEYIISGGSLNAVRINSGGNGTTAAKFSVHGSSADISFSAQSFLTGQTELEFVLDSAGASALMMTNGGYLKASTVSLTVDASAYIGSAGDGILLIGVSEGDGMDEFTNVSVTEGFALDYREGDGIYLTGGSAGPGAPAYLSITGDAGSVTVSATGLTVGATYTLKELGDLSETNWNSIASVSGVSQTNWVLAASNSVMFYRVDSE